MWSTIRTVATRALLAGSPVADTAAGSTTTAAALRRIATSVAVAGARPRPRSALFLSSLGRNQHGHLRPLQSRGFTVSALLKEEDAPAKKPAKKATKKKAAKKKGAATKTKKATAAEKKPKKPAAAKKKAAKKKATKKELTPLEKLKIKIKNLKAQTLQEPTKLVQHPWLLFVAEKTTGVPRVRDDKGRPDMGPLSRDVAQDFKALPPAELHRLRDQATKNSEANVVAYKAWVTSHTPLEIFQANQARRKLNRIGQKHKFDLKYRIISDDRIPKRPLTAFGIYSTSQWKTGKYAGTSIMDAGRKSAEEWKELSAAERQKYEAEYAVEFQKYVQAVQDALGLKVKTTRAPSPSQ